MSKKTIQIIVILIAIVAIFFVYKAYYVDNNTGDSTLVAQNTSNQTFAEGQVILALINKLNGIRIDQTVFSNNIFLSLVDFEQPIADQIAGRPNPFQPIGIDTTGVYVPKTTSNSKTR